jgi:hypothetical protein
METNIESIKLINELLLEVPINKNDVEFSMLIAHPYTNNIMAISRKGGILNLLNEEDFNTFKKERIELIRDKKTNLNRLYYMINKAYRFLWFKLAYSYLSEKDFSEYLSDVWVSSENPNKDANVTLKEAVNFFKMSKKNFLMEKEDYKVYQNIPEKITLYRGVGNKREPYGLSYTASKSKAEWFQNRFGPENSFIITLEVDKNDILAYFNTRSEDEYVVDVFKYKNKIKPQIP